MVSASSLLQQKVWRYIDHSKVGLTFSALQSFAYDDTFCTSVGGGESDPIFRSWVHAPTIVLGIQDGKLPFLQEGIAFLKEHNYEIIIRNSGGLAVVLDEGILNLSLILPEGKGIDINSGYQAMWNLIQLMLARYRVPIEAKEIIGSYCPGSFDLSINNQKFAGISQRRLRNGVAVQIYICVTGSGSKRAEYIREFYNISLQNEHTKMVYPKIVPSTMASLAELLNVNLSISEVITLVLDALKKLGSLIIPTEKLTENEQALFTFNYNRILKRNHVIHSNK